MKAGIVLALTGAALAADYGYGAGETTTSVTWPAAGEKTSTTATWPTPTGGADDEECDEEETSTWTPEGTWPATSSTPAGAWGAKPTTSSTPAGAWGSKSSPAGAYPAKSSPAGAWPAGSSSPAGAKAASSSPAGAWAAASSVPAYFASDYACCKTVVTVTEWGTMGAKPTVSSSASPVWSSPAAAWSSPAAAASPSASWSSPAAAWSSPAAPWSSPAAAASPSAAWSSPAAAWSSPAAASSSPAASSGSWSNIKPNGNKWAVTYTPYTTSGQCKSASDVDSDMATIASWGFSTVRLYATDCSGLQNVGTSAKAHGLKIIVGVFVDSTGLSAAWTQVDQITTWGNAGNWANVAMIVVGNECVFNGYASASDLAAFITKAKGAWSGAGYNGPVTTTEPVNIIQQYAGDLCSVIDVVAANIQPFFTSSVSSSWAGSFVQGQIALIEAACPGKTGYNLESGWPSAGSANGAASPSPSDQKAAINDILSKAGDVTCIFSFQDDAWKDAGSFGVEQHFGCGSVFGSSSY